MKIALVSYKKEKLYNQGLESDEDLDLLNYLQSKSLEVNVVIWNDPNVNWNKYDIAILKSPWDYHNHLNDFNKWLDYIKGLNIKLLNPIDIVQWNSHKKYLQDFIEAGLPVIPAKFLNKGDQFNDYFFKYFNTGKLVVKPCVSAGAQNTFVVDQSNLETLSLKINELLQQEDFIVQPFVNEIKDGEWSLLFFNGKYSHSVLKKPLKNDFRVQHFYGGSIEYIEANSKYVNEAEKFIKHLPHSTLYARVDGVIINNNFNLMELELIEPYLFLNNDNQNLENYYQALMQLAK